MAERHDYSETVAEMLIQLQPPGAGPKPQRAAQTRVLARMERGGASLDHLQSIQGELRDVKAGVKVVNMQVQGVKQEINDLKAAARLAGHEGRPRRPEDFMRRVS